MANQRFTKRAINFISAVFRREVENRQNALPKKHRKQGRGSLFDGAAPSLFATGDNGVGDQLEVHQSLIGRMVDYEHMDQYPECSAALTVMADDATQPDSSTGRTLEVEADDPQIKESLEELLFQRLDMDGQIWEIARSLCKYGNDYEEILIDPTHGVVGLEFVSAPTVRRVETREDGLLGFVQDPQGQFDISPQDFKAIMQDQKEVPTSDIALLHDFQMVHFRLRSLYRNSAYGFSILEPARWIWKRLVLLEDAVLVHKLSRAPSRYAFYIDVGKRNAREAMKYLNKVKQKLKKRKIVNKNGQLDLKMNPLGFDEDFFIPVIDGQDSARIDVLTGPDFQGMEEAEYFRSKLYVALGVPQSRLMFGEQRDARTVLSNDDVQFARSVLRVQRELRNGLRKICRVHLAALGIDPASTFFEVYMTIPSGIYEIAQMEIRNARADLAARMREFVSLEWLLAEVFGFDQQTIKQIKEQRAAEAEAVNALSGGIGGGLGGPEQQIAWADGHIGQLLREEDREHRRLSARDRRQMRDTFTKLLRESSDLRSQLTEVRFMLKDLQRSLIHQATSRMRSNGSRNGAYPRRVLLDGGFGG